jgi:putative tryptophan/tyrosine transport system substrate-binding protein
MGASICANLSSTRSHLEHDPVRRRDFIKVAFVPAATWPLSAWPLSAWAQKAKKPVIGLLGSTSAEAYASRVASVRKGLSEAGFIEGQNVTIDSRWADGHYERLPAMAADLVRSKVDVILAITTPAAVAAKAATTTIPVVFEVGSDPVKLGLVAGLSKPGGNLTGVSLLNMELAAKRLELLHGVVPTTTIFGLLINPKNSNAEAISKDVQEAAKELGIQIHVQRAATEADLEPAFASLRELGARALVIGTDPLFNVSSERLAALTLRYVMPSIYQYRPFAAAGGLLSYGDSSTEPFRQAGAYVGRILKGAKPGELAIQQSTKVELIINLTTAKTLGIRLPIALIARADEIVD